MKAIRDMCNFFMKTARSSGSGNRTITVSSSGLLIISVIVLLVGIIS